MVISPVTTQSAPTRRLDWIEWPVKEYDSRTCIVRRRSVHRPVMDFFRGNRFFVQPVEAVATFEIPGGPSYLKPGTLTIAQMLKTKGYRTGVFGKWHVGLTWYDKDGKRLGGGFENVLLIDYEKSTPLVDGPNERGFDESFVTPNCPNTDPLYIYIETAWSRCPPVNDTNGKTCRIPGASGDGTMTKAGWHPGTNLSMPIFCFMKRPATSFSTI